MRLAVRSTWSLRVVPRIGNLASFPQWHATDRKVDSMVAPEMPMKKRGFPRWFGAIDYQVQLAIRKGGDAHDLGDWTVRLLSAIDGNPYSFSGSSLKTLLRPCFP